LQNKWESDLTQTWEGHSGATPAHPSSLAINPSPKLKEEPDLKG